MRARVRTPSFPWTPWVTIERVPRRGETVVVRRRLGGELEIGAPSDVPASSTVVVIEGKVTRVAVLPGMNDVELWVGYET